MLSPGVKVGSVNLGVRVRSVNPGVRVRSVNPGVRGGSVNTGVRGGSASTGVRACSASTGVRACSASTGVRACSASTGVRTCYVIPRHSSGVGLGKILHHLWPIILYLCLVSIYHLINQHGSSCTCILLVMSLLFFTLGIATVKLVCSFFTSKPLRSL